MFSGIEKKYLKPTLGETDDVKKERMKEILEGNTHTFIPLT